jgi:hypothetical protein
VYLIFSNKSVVQFNVYYFTLFVHSLWSLLGVSTADIQVDWKALLLRIFVRLFFFTFELSFYNIFYSCRSLINFILTSNDILLYLEDN